MPKQPDAVFSGDFAGIVQRAYFGQRMTLRLHGNQVELDGTLVAGLFNELSAAGYEPCEIDPNDWARSGDSFTIRHTFEFDTPEGDDVPVYGWYITLDDTDEVPLAGVAMPPNGKKPPFVVRMQGDKLKVEATKELAVKT